MTATPVAATDTELTAAVRAEMERWSVPGLAIGVLHDGQIESWGYGISSIETHQPVTAETLFQVGSITKPFTATLIMQLVEAGMIELDTPVITYLPSLRLADDAATRGVTARHLLTHTAGFFGDRFDDDTGLGDDALMKSVAMFDSLRQYTMPGAIFAYCNTGYRLLGAVAEQLLDRPYEGAIGERIFKPLGMKRSFFFAHEAITYPVAVGHLTLPGQETRVARPYPIPRSSYSAGGIISTVGDLLRFASFHLGLPDTSEGATPIITQHSIQALQEPVVETGVTQRGLGWTVEQIGGERAVGHNGATNGFQSELLLFPERKLALAMLTNSNQGGAAMRGIEAFLLERYAGLHRDELPLVSLPQETLTRYAGSYETPLSRYTLTATATGLELVIASKNPFSGESTTSKPYQARPVGERTFRIIDGPIAGSSFDFILDGEVNGRLEQEPAEHPASSTTSDRPRFLRFGGRLADPLD